MREYATITFYRLRMIVELSYSWIVFLIAIKKLSIILVYKVLPDYGVPHKVNISNYIVSSDISWKSAAKPSKFKEEYEHNYIQ